MRGSVRAGMEAGFARHDMKTRKYSDEQLTELGRRLAIAEASVFAGVTYRTAEKTIDAVRGPGSKPGSFWLQLAEIALEARAEAIEEDSGELFRLQRKMGRIQ
jgi:hypothetical protein